ncbi:MAG: tRNA (adenosine(37)-N6)-threonylcarbamoyltransferase complex ATPase subunit type 1 TsaE [Syntrophomonadaceae bacterium]|jgi:tRNA threonylcarbamoyladenosine biosynthesis protein TsaE
MKPSVQGNTYYQNRVGWYIIKFRVASENQMEQLGSSIARVLESGDVVLLFGELGVGKTTLVRGIARGLGFEGIVNSPSFTLMNIYDTIPVIYHFDFYRLSISEVEDLGLEDYLEKDGICIIEWPQNANLISVEGFYIHIDLIDGDYDLGRQVFIEARGDEHNNRLGRLSAYVDSGS